MKKKLAVILASAMAVSLTACGGSKAPETTAAAAKTEARQRIPKQKTRQRTPRRPAGIPRLLLRHPVTSCCIPLCRKTS